MATKDDKANDKTSRLQIYVWKGTDRSGEKSSGEINAPTLIAAKIMLRNDGINVTKVKKKSKDIFAFFTKRISPRDISFFTRELATMLKAGIPLVQSFDIVSKGQENPEFQKLVLQLKQDVEEGNTLNEAFKKYPKYFNNLYCSLVAAGEQAGALDDVLDRLATHKEKVESLKGKIRKALFYPAAVVCVAIGVTAALLIFVVPQFQSLFQGFGAHLPYFTQLVINLSDFMQHYWWLVFGTMIIAGWGLYTARRRSKAFAHLLDRLVLRTPIIGKILQKAAVARFARTLATTFAAGVPIVDGLTSVANASGNIVYADATRSIIANVTKGQQLQLAMRNTHIFPEMVVQMVTVGEASGTLEKMLAKVADFYEEEVDNIVDSLSSLLEPVILVVLGVLVGGLVIAMYLPIFKLGTVV